MRIALATCSQLPAGFEEDELAAGLGACWEVWDDDSVDWAAYDVVVVRSVWDADQRRDEFVRWAHATPATVLNPPAVLEWNTDKHYLAELPGAGLPTVPTRFLRRGETLTDGVLDEFGAAAEVVVKPTQSAGARDTGRFRATTTDREQAAALAARIQAAGKVAMLQPYLDSVDSEGETALLYFGGAFSHAIRKGQILEAGAAPVTGIHAADPEITPRRPTHAQRALGDRAIAWLTARFGRPLAYARVDLVTDPDGAPVIIELELTEPHLYLLHADDAADRLASAIRALAS